jgi:protein subunit release factor A
MPKEKLFSVTKKDLEIQTFQSGGKGGQHQNKTDSGVRIIHRASGAVGESRTEKSQKQNKKLALQRLAAAPKFKLWLNKMAYELKTGKSIEERVDEMMNEDNLKIEARDEKGKWQSVTKEA